VPFRLLKSDEADTLEALGETLAPGARAAGIAHFIDHQLSVPPEEALLEARILNVRPPYVNFYRAAVGAIDRASQSQSGRRFAVLPSNEQRDFVNLMRQNKIEGWQGPAVDLSTSCCAVTRSTWSTAPSRATRRSASPTWRTSCR